MRHIDSPAYEAEQMDRAVQYLLGEGFDRHHAELYADYLCDLRPCDKWQLHADLLAGRISHQVLAECMDEMK